MLVTLKTMELLFLSVIVLGALAAPTATLPNDRESVESLAR